MAETGRVRPGGAVAWLVLAGLLALHVRPARAQEASPSPPAPQAQQGGLVELVIGQARRLPVPGVQRFLLGDPTLANISQESNALLVQAVAPGRTFLHAWTATGRISFVLRVLHIAPVAPPREDAVERALWERSDPLKIDYSVNYESIRRGQDFEQADQDTTNIFTQTIRPFMPTPYGFASGAATFQRINQTQDWSTWYAQLLDGHVGPVRRFDATIGDTAVPYIGGFATPTVGYRGGTFVYRDVDPWTATGLWGQERTSIFATTVGQGSQELDSYVTGGGLAYRHPSSPWSMDALVLGGYGDDRLPTQGELQADIINRLRIIPPLTFELETAIDDGPNLGYTAGSVWQSSRNRSRVTWRQVDEDFRTISGPVAYRGERGVRGETFFELTPTVSLTGLVDYYQNELFANPNDPDAWNLDATMDASWRVAPRTYLSGSVGERRYEATLSPSRERRWGVGAAHGLPIGGLVPWLTVLDLYGRYDHSEFRSSTAPELDYDSELFSAGAAVPLPYGFTASITHDWRLLEELRTGVTSEPRRLSSNLSHYSSFLDGLWQLRGRVGFDRDFETESLRSFLPGQDRIVGEAGVTFQPWDSTSLYADGRIEDVRFDGAEEDRTEYALLTGARVLFDTGFVRWDHAGSVQGVVFQDVNGDGQQQPEEPGIKGVTVIAGLATKTKTDAQGRFRFWRITGKAVPIGIDVKTLPTGYAPSSQRVQVVRPKETPQATLAFGASARGQIRGQVFLDTDGNRKASPGDRGIPGVSVQLDSQRSKTDPQGWFSFTNLPSGTYTVALSLESLPIQYLPQVPVRQVVELPDGGLETVEYPVATRSSLNGRVFVDINKNGQPDPGEEGLSGLPICLDGRRVAKTDATGAFQFADVQGGQHRVLLNCGMPIPGFYPLSPPEVMLNLGAGAAELNDVQFRLERLPSSLPVNVALPVDDAGDTLDGAGDEELF